MSEILSDESTSFDTEPNTEAIQIASLMANAILERDPQYRFLVADKREKTLGNWAGDIDKINRIDGRPWEQIRSVVGWYTKDDFWSVNIVSGSKLRKQFDQLVLKMPTNDIDTIPDFMQEAM